MRARKSNSAPSDATLEFARPLVTVDVALLTLAGDDLQVLLVQRPQTPGEPYPARWALPGGFIDVQKDHDLQGCAMRKLREKTALSSPYLEQVGSWGGAERDPRGWSATHVYFALVPRETSEPGRGGNAADARWFDVTLDGFAPGAGALAFDHDELLCAALQRLRSKVEYTSLPAFLLAEPFTLPQLQGAYEAVLGRPLDRSAFRRRALAVPGFLREAGIIHTGAPRAPQGYVLERRDGPVVFARPFEPR